MKTKITMLVLFLFSGATAYSQEAKLDSWKELKDFHEVMAATFHASQENNLKPIKARATEMKDKSMTLNNSAFPKEFDTEAIRSTVKRLTGQCINLEKMVNAKTPDKDITRLLSQAHGTFHEVVGLCSGGEEPMKPAKEEGGKKEAPVVK